MTKWRSRGKESARAKATAIARRDGPRSVDIKPCESKQGIAVAIGSVFVNKVEISIHPPQVLECL